MDKFLLAENPIKDDTNRQLFIIHTIQPIMFIEVHHEAIAVGDSRSYLIANYSRGGLIETITLHATKVFVCNPEISEELKDKVEQVLKRAWRWYSSYLNWEDDNIDKSMN